MRKRTHRAGHTCMLHTRTHARTRTHAETHKSVNYLCDTQSVAVTEVVESTRSRGRDDNPVIYVSLTGPDRKSGPPHILVELFGTRRMQ